MMNGKHSSYKLVKEANSLPGINLYAMQRKYNGISICKLRHVQVVHAALMPLTCLQFWKVKL